MYKEDRVKLGPMLTSQQIQVHEILSIYLEMKHRHSASLGYGTAPFPSGLKLLLHKA